jgi:hypothetical protein
MCLLAQHGMVLDPLTAALARWRIIGGMDAAEQTSAVLDAIALVEARLRGDDEALSFLLDQTEGSHRPVAVVLADMVAQCLQGEFGEQAAEATSQLREQLLSGS